MKKGTLMDANKNADVLIGASPKNVFSKELIKEMADKPIVFALSNPIPEIDYYEAKKAGAFVVATGRSDFPNQINNFIAFAGVLRGILNIHANSVNNEMFIGASNALAMMIKDSEINSENIIPKFKDEKSTMEIIIAVANEVAKQAIKTKVTKQRNNEKQNIKEMKELFKKYNKLEKCL